MRPDREEMLAGVRRALAEFVAPEVTSVYGRTELTYAVSLLAAISRESEDAVANLVQENTALRRLLREAGRRLHGSAVREDALLRDLAAVGAPLPRPDLRLSALRDENGRMLDLLIRLQAACEDCPGDRAVSVVYRRTLAFLRVRSDLQTGLRAR